MAAAGAAPDMGGQASAQHEGGNAGAAESAKDKGKVVDADFEVVDGDKKA